MRKLALGAVLAVAAFVALLVVQALIARLGPVDSFENPSREPRMFGEGGQPLTYVVLGDSTGAGQGAPYERGIAVETARHLADSRAVSLVNLTVSGAQMSDVVDDQLEAATALRPDVVLLAAGANDVIGLTSTSTVARELGEIVDGLRAANPDVAIVVTGAPDMGSPPRIPQPLRTLAGWRTDQVNSAIEEVVEERQLTLAPIAERTGERFREDSHLFADDGFHPNARGYAIWVPVLNEALDEALAADKPEKTVKISNGRRTKCYLRTRTRI